MEREKYYVNVSSGEISKTMAGDNPSFVIYATMDEVKDLRHHLDHMDEASFGSFWRSHIPFKPYHEDPENDEHDKHMRHVYQILYDCGTEEARQVIRDMNVIH